MPNNIRDDLHKVDRDNYDYIYEENVTVNLKDGKGLIRCNVYRPKDESVKYPALVTYGPYGKVIGAVRGLVEFLMLMISAGHTLSGVSNTCIFLMSAIYGDCVC